MIDFLAQAPLYVLPFLLVLTVVVTIHELGHFLVARAFGVKIDRFAIGFGRGLLSRTDRQGTEWRLGWIPLGGYVKFSGDLDPSSVPDQAGLAELKDRIIAEQGPEAIRDYFHFKPVWQRALIVLAGPMANFVLAIVVFTLLFSLIGVQIQPARVAQVSAGSPAASAGFLPGDLITGINGRRVEDQRDVTRIVSLSSGDRLRFMVERGGDELTLTAVPERETVTDPVAGRITVGRIGLGLLPAMDEIRHVRYGPIAAVGQAVSQTGDVLATSIRYIGRIFTGRESGDQLSGPIGIAKASGALTSAAVEANPDPGATAFNLIVTMTSFAAILSIGIGFLNLLPIPILDGGHLVFYGYEAVAKKPVAARFQEAGFRVGLALLAGLMLFATWNDLQKLNLFKFLGGLA
ncbi:MULTISPECIES: M50 family metallopeptidase [unclassified Brevundimonas]|jgi:regulator of sigma E protease|uniref:M50 family metallopeptidase n=1 Tax=unclassified Brevundimonas TaxID=2622653 RepID=UPI000C38250C|nr:MULTISPECIES: M50 family metallopeptidase [unclassified Brevundimonas]MAL88652.1 RIP metalloprotease RseP [Brevundimonas sp.]MAL89741.1 RIP metalloprotease RseP [Brevundimonas sp.]HAV49812.1 RIP metalloprotease RseP [Brevundimonas sp.]|tara:strand:+ start:24348 stop:25562 length:1215 start_codon:yes stop_codon:yes gene_type:complete